MQSIRELVKGNTEFKVNKNKHLDPLLAGQLPPRPQVRAQWDGVGLETFAGFTSLPAFFLMFRFLIFYCYSRTVVSILPAFKVS